MGACVFTKLGEEGFRRDTTGGIIRGTRVVPRIRGAEPISVLWVQLHGRSRDVLVLRQLRGPGHSQRGRSAGPQPTLRYYAGKLVCRLARSPQTSLPA